MISIIDLFYVLSYLFIDFLSDVFIFIMITSMQVRLCFVLFLWFFVIIITILYCILTLLGFCIFLSKLRNLHCSEYAYTIEELLLLRAVAPAPFCAASFMKDLCKLRSHFSFFCRLFSKIKAGQYTIPPHVSPVCFSFPGCENCVFRSSRRAPCATAKCSRVRQSFLPDCRSTTLLPVVTKDCHLVVCLVSMNSACLPKKLFFLCLCTSFLECKAYF